MKKVLLIIALFLFIQSCDDKKTQQFGGVNLTIQKQIYNESSEAENDIDVEIKLDKDDFELTSLKNKEIQRNVIKSDDVFRSFRVRNENDLDSNLNIETSENQITDIDAVRVTLNNGQPTTVPIINGSASYSRDGLAVGVIPIKVDLLGGGLEKYTQTKSVSIVANQNASVSFNSFFLMNQQISITNSSFGNTVVQGDQISFEWTNTHAEQPVEIAVIQNNDNNIIQTLESSYIGTSYVLNTTNSNPTNNIGFKVSSKVASNTSSSICCFDLVANAPQANNISSTVNEDSSVTIQLDGSSPGGESVTYSIVSNPSNGSLSGISGSNITYTPNQDYNGSDSFTYRVNNGSTDSNIATVTLTINAVNDAPVANNISAETNFNDAVDLQFDASDVDGDNLSYFIVSGASNGTLTLHSNNQVEYLPNSGFSGSDTFTYGATDGSLNSNTATASVTVGESIEITFPNGGEELSINESYTLTWINGFSNTGIELRKDGSKILDISGDAGDVESLAWTVPSNLTPGEGYVIRVYDAGGGTGFDESDNDFSIISSGGTAEITSPNGGEILRTGLNYTITWNGGFSNTGIELYKGETKVLDINGDVGSSNSYEWSIPQSLSIGDDYKIRVYDAGNGENFDDSDSYFSIFEQSNFSSSNISSLSLSENSYISLQEIDSNLGKANNSITISSWFKTDKNPNQDVIIHASTTNEQFGRMGFTDSGANGKLYFGRDDVSGSTDFTDNRLWNHMVYVADAQNNELKIYVNGVLENTMSINTGKDYYDANRIWQIGHYSEEGTQHDFTGLLDEVAVWNTVLTSNDISSLYNNGNPTLAYNIKLSNLRAYYDFEDNSLNDKTGRAVNPTFSINFGFSNNVPPNNDGIVTFPAGGEKLICGRTYPIRWESGFADNGIELYNGSQKISEINGDAGSGNKFSWTIDCATAGEGYSIRIYDAGAGNEYFQGGTFEIDTDPKNKYNGLETISYTYTSSTPVTTSTTFQSNKSYYMEASGTVYYSNQNLMDAAYRLRGSNQDIDPPVPYDDNQSWTWNGQVPPRPIEDHYNDSHVYDYYFTGTNEPISVVFNDSGYSDNGGTLIFKFYEIETNRPPTTDDVNASIDENRNSLRMANISLAGNDPDGDNLTYSLVTTPQNGSFSIDGNILTYEPNKDWYGSEVFTYKANDGNLDSNTSTITITVNSVNDTPIINSGSSLYLDGVDDYAYISAENNNIILSNSDFTLAAWIVLEDLDDSTNAATIMSTGTGSTNNGLYFMIDGGELELSFYGNNLLETSDLGFEGDNTWHHVTATFEASSRTAKLYVDGVLEATNSFDSTFAGEGTNFTVGATAWNLNDNFEGYIDEAAVWNEVLNTSQIISLADDSRNPLEIGTASAYWEFEPDTNNPTIITDLTLNGNNLQNNGTIETNGTKITTSTLEDTSVNIQLYVNDVDGDALSYSIVDNPTNGSTSINSNIITYTPGENYNGSDTFTYKASDGNLESDTGTVDVTVVAVNDAPVSSEVSLSVLKNATKTISLSATDVDGDNLTYSIVSNVSNGTLGSISGNQISYTPNNNFLGTDTFTFKANDGTVDSNIETVTITVKAVSITSPNGGETLTHNTTATITWDGGFTNTGIELYKNGSKILDISGDAGNVNSYQWNVPSGVGTGSDFTIKVYDAGPGNESDESDASFTIQA